MKTFTKKRDGSLLTPKFRVSFPYVFDPDDSGKYGLAMIFDSKTDFSLLDDLIEKTIEEKWGKTKPKGLMMPVLDGDDSGRSEYEGCYYINGKCGKFRPGVVDQKLQDISDPEEFYPGCWARANITCYAWEYKNKKGVSVNVRNIQKIADDEPLVSRVRAADDFEELPEEDDL